MATLDIGQHYSTADLGMRYNWITDHSTFAIYSLAQSLLTLRYLNLGSCALTNEGLNEVMHAVLESPSLLYFVGRSVHPQQTHAAAVPAGQQRIKSLKRVRQHLKNNVRKQFGEEITYDKFLEEEKRWLVNDEEDVRKIDSVYRNRDAGLARRRLKKLSKCWDEDDETLNEVMAAEPICTLKKRAKA